MLEPVIVLAGLVLMSGAFADAAVTVLHPDAEGPAARFTQSAVWRLMRSGGRRVRAAAGPVMLLATFLTWMVGFILGYALVIWPYLETSFRSEPEIGSVGLTEAIYHSGITVTVLGYGDLTALTWPLQFLAIVASGGGFILLTAIATYMIQLVSGISPRVRFALHAHDETRGEHDGVQLVLDRLAADSVPALDHELQRWATMVREADEGLHRQPRVGLFYRSTDPSREPEPAMAVALELSIAAEVLAHDARYVHLRPRADSLGRACDRLIDSVSAQHLPKAVQELLAGAPGADAHREAERLVARLEASPSADLSTCEVRPEEAIVRAVHRRRVFLDAMQALTGWQDHRPRRSATTQG